MNQGHGKWDGARGSLFGRGSEHWDRARLGAGEPSAPRLDQVLPLDRHRRGACPHSRGFTLIELMIVVVILGVLATLAVYSVYRYVQRSKTAEAREIVGQIMAAQESYFDEVGAYMDVTGGVEADSNYYPAGGFNGREVIQWGANDGCNNGATPCGEAFKRLGVYVANPVMFRYAATDVASGVAPPTPTGRGAGFNPSAVTMPRPGYVVSAMSDLDNDGGERTVVLGSSLQAQLFIENPGE